MTTSSSAGLASSVSMMTISSTMGPGGTSTGAIGPLSASDARAVFLNIESLATLSNDFASILEVVVQREMTGEGVDMVGETFLAMVGLLSLFNRASESDDWKSTLR